MNRALVLCLGLVACGGGSRNAYEAAAPREERAMAHGGGDSESRGSRDMSPAASPGYEGQGHAQAAEASKSADAPAPMSRSQASEPQARPGLGTEWGETRESRVYETSFVRTSSDPFATISLHYNDQRGIDALSRFHHDRPSRQRSVVDNGWVTVGLRDSSNSPFDSYRFGDRNYVVGQAGERYSIVLNNRTAHRIEAVTTVDGLDVINGQNGSMSNRGYILMPYATVEIDGFRKNQGEVAAFRFGAVEDSYAAERGKPRNIGVIGVALFDERGDRIDRRELEMRDTANPFPENDRRYAPPPPRR
jgi:hypothetical protein